MIARGLKEKINNKTAKVAVIGLGYVGLPITLEFSKAGFDVFGIDTDKKRLNTLLNKRSYILEIPEQEIKSAIDRKNFFPKPDYKILKEVDIIIICVPTPLRKTKIPNISYIMKATRTIGKYFKRGSLIIVESTTYPGTTRDVILPILSKGGLVEGKDFFLAFSPERIDPGNEKYSLANIPKVVGGISKKAGELTREIYSKIIKKVIMVSSAEAAEIVKLLENTFRIVNIGLINEFAMLCNKLKINAWEVVEAAKTKPFGFMPFYPGPGIGGHCIPADPLYLSWKARKVGFRTKMIDLASKTNLFMPYYVCQQAEKLLIQQNVDISKAKILIMGVTYKKDVNDLRESPALDIIEILKKKGVKVSYCDPYIPYLKIDDINLKRCSCTAKNIRGSDLLVLVTDHTGFDYKFLAANAGLVLDTRNIFGRLGIKTNNIVTL
ncbi:MAG: nucleotide sugar dehydrogenase [Candidatus Omnitrophota bacterium]|nr:nucleotide sugar dehydrogenase [Candidatus Omnitrophota bacterium]